ncbi:MAG: hypothetical protein ACLFVP_01350 [Candidatus Bathyarchaeia archaeon]
MISTDDMDTDDVLEIAKREQESRGVKDIVVASTTGSTGLKAAKLFKDTNTNLVVIPHSSGFREPNKDEFYEKNRMEIESLGGTVVFSTMPFHTINDAIRVKMGSSTLSLIADTLRMMGQGTKVCVEIVTMACDTGHIDSDEDVIAIAGTGRGADTVLLINSANSRRFFNIKIKDVIAKPQLG